MSSVYYLGQLSVKPIETPVAVVPLTTNIPTTKVAPTHIVDPTVNWKTYENKQYGFSFKYPTALKLSPDPQFPDNYTLKNSSTFIAFNIQSTCLNTQCLTIQNLDEIANNMLGLDVLSTFKIGDSKGIRITNGFMVEIPNSNNFLLLNSGQYTAVVDQILSTFKLTESKDNLSTLLTRLNQYLSANLSFSNEVDGRTINLSDYYNPEFAKYGNKIDLIKKALIDSGFVYDKSLDKTIITTWTSTYKSPTNTCVLDGNEENLSLICN